ncbi:unnamed protein product, partial [Heterotrigona itama]
MRDSWQMFDVWHSSHCWYLGSGISNVFSFNFSRDTVCKVSFGWDIIYVSYSGWIQIWHSDRYKSTISTLQQSSCHCEENSELHPGMM